MANTPGYKAPLRICRRCKKLRHHCGRGLCSPCRGTASRNGTLHLYPSVNTRIPEAEFVEDYLIYSRRGWSNAKIAAQLGITTAALSRRTARLRAKGKLPAVKGYPRDENHHLLRDKG